MKEKSTSKRSMFTTTLMMGFALFATQFGAGNLIFPPFLGRNTGSDWMVGFLGFFLTDVGLAALAVLSVVANRKGTVDGVVGKMGHRAGKALVTTIILCLGPGLCIPRTAATSYELGIKTMAPGIPLWLFGAVFFAIVLFLVIRPTQVVDIIGKYLTPALLAVMALLIVIGIVHPVSTSVDMTDVVPFTDGIQSGYQTLDGIGGVLMTMVMMNAAIGYGYRDKKDITKLIAGADVVSTILLAAVYGGLTYLGSTVSGLDAYSGLDQAPLLIAITHQLMGRYGVYALSIIVILACLTTALGACLLAGNYFEELSNGKLKYEWIVTAIIVLSYAMSNFGLTQIISIAAPILSLLYPPLIVLVIGAFTEKLTDNDHVICVATYAALAVSALELLHSLGAPFGFVTNLPFASFGMGWVVPALIGAGVGAFWKKDSKILSDVVEEAEEEALAE